MELFGGSLDPARNSPKSGIIWGFREAFGEDIFRVAVDDFFSV